jgi:hypothetical protein
MSLSRKLAQLEILARAQAEEAAPASPYRTPERVERWRQWVARLLETMPEERARRVFEELAVLPADQRGPVARRVEHMAYLGAQGIYDAVGWPYWSERAVAMPDAVCEALEQHPEASFTIGYSCEDCGLEVPHQPYAGPALLAFCPLCRGAVRHCGYTDRRLHEAWLGQSSMPAAG